MCVNFCNLKMLIVWFCRSEKVQGNCLKENALNHSLHSPQYSTCNQRVEEVISIPTEFMDAIQVYFPKKKPLLTAQEPDRLAGFVERLLPAVSNYDEFKEVNIGSSCGCGAC